MKVRVILSGQSLIVEPDPALALVSEPMYWEFVAAARNLLIRWEFCFEDCTPFGSALKRPVTEFAPIAPAGSTVACHRRPSPLCRATTSTVSAPTTQPPKRCSRTEIRS